MIYEHPYPMHIHACTGIYLVPRVCNTLVQWNIGNGEPWPIPQDNGNTNSGNYIGFLSFWKSRMECLAVRCSCCFAAMGCGLWAVGLLLAKPVKVYRQKHKCEGDLYFAYWQISFDFHYPLCLTSSHTLKPKAKKIFIYSFFIYLFKIFPSSVLLI